MNLTQTAEPFVMITGTHDLRLVALSLLIAVLASYTALELVGRVTVALSPARIIWLTVGAITMGLGIWSMHFVGMLAFSLPVPINYDAPTVLLSMLAAVIASFAALLLASRASLNRLQLLGGCVFMGLGIASMHYIGMVAMRVPAFLYYNHLLVALSVVIAITASCVALWLAFELRSLTTWNWHKLLSAVVMGGAIGGMHYTAMAAAHFTRVLGLRPTPDYTLDKNVLAITIGMTTLVILGLTLLVSQVNQRRSVQVKAQELLQKVILKMHVGVLLLGPQWEIHLSNPAACVLLGRTESQLLGTIAFTTDWDVIHSDDTPFPNETFSVSQVLQTKCALHNVVVGIYRPLSQDRVWLLVNAEPQIKADGSVEQVICTLSDLTERKQAESERLQLANHIKLLLESTEEGIYGIDLQGCCTFINTNGAKMLGYKPDEVIGRDMHKLIHHSYSDGSPYPNHLCPIFRAFRIGQSCRVESEVLWRLDGTAFAAEYSSYPIIESLDIKGAVVTFRDITKRKRAEEALRQSETQLREQATKLEQALHELQQTQAQLIQTEKMSSLGHMVAGMAHEINNPVSFIYGNLQYTDEYIQDLLKLVQLYQEQYPQPTPAIQAHTKDIDLEFLRDDLPRMLDSMKTGAERIRSLVLSLRNFSRLDEAQVKQVDLHEGIDNTLLILNHSLKTRITITKQYGDLPLVECYPAQMNQVFMNLLSNAIDAMSESFVISHLSLVGNNGLMTNDRQMTSPQIHIRTKLVDDNWVAITIADNGPGIRLEIIDKIFDPFFTTKPVGKGTGLGLAICYQIIEKHQGQISVNSQPDRGTEFVITLPTKRTSKGV